MDHLTITAHSTALFSTWIFVEEMRLLFDAGDGVMSGLMHKAGKIKHVAMSHADRDHVYGLLQLNHHNAHNGLEAVFYPAAAGAFLALRDFCWRFDSETRDAYPWVPVRPGDSYELGRNLALRVVENSHIPVPNKSVGYIVARQFRKLKSEYAHLDPVEIERLGRELGSSTITEPREEPLLGYSGDTGVCPPQQWAGCRTLIHEATFLRHEDVESERAGYEHSVLIDVLRMAREARVERLLLGHFSSRYKADEIVAAIREGCRTLQIAFPVSAILPGRLVRDVFAAPPVWPERS